MSMRLLPSLGDSNHHLGVFDWRHLSGDYYLAEVDYDANDNDADDKKETRHLVLS